MSKNTVRPINPAPSPNKVSEDTTGGWETTPRIYAPSPNKVGEDTTRCDKRLCLTAPTSKAKAPALA